MKKGLSGCLTIVGGIVVLMFIFGACSVIMFGSEDSGDQTVITKEAKDTAKETTKPEPHKTHQKEKQKKPVANLATIGDTVTVGDMQYRVNSFKVKKVLGNEYFNSKANGTYVLLNVTIKNNGSDEVTIDSNFFELHKGKKTYETDANGTLYANMDSKGKENTFFLQGLNPDSKMTGTIAFDVAPQVAKSNNLKLQVQTGFWGTETKMIQLRK